MNGRSNADVVRAFYAAQYAGDPEKAFDDNAASDLVFLVSTVNEDLRCAIPWAGYEHKGRAGFLDLVEKLFGEFEPLEFEADHYAEAGDTVFVEGHFVFKHRQTGKTAVSDWFGRFRMRDGRIADAKFYENTAAVAAARKP